MVDGTEIKENERGFREDTTLTSSWTELVQHTKKFTIAGSIVNKPVALVRDQIIAPLTPQNEKN